MGCRLRGDSSPRKRCRREEGFCKRTAESPAELASIYQLGGRSTIDDPTLGQSVRPDWIKLEGLLDNVSVSFLSRKLEDARQQKKNLFILELDSPGGTEAAADRIADILSELSDMKTIAYINERALGVAALVPLACRDIVFKKGARMGDVRQTVSGRNATLRDLSDMAKAGLAKKAAAWAKAKGHPDAVAVRHDRSRCRNRRGKRLSYRREQAHLALRSGSRARPIPHRQHSQIAGSRTDLERRRRCIIWPGSRGQGR